MVRTVGFRSGCIFKEFVREKFPGDLRRPWRREHKALIRLEQKGVEAPRSFGYRRDGRGTISYYREFVPGQSVDQIGAEILSPLVKHLADIHCAGIIVGDLIPDNLIKIADSQVMFIDFGRARTFRFRSPLFFFHAGKELVRIYREALLKDKELWRCAQSLYDENARWSRAGKSIIRFAERYWFRYWNEEWVGK